MAADAVALVAQTGAIVAGEGALVEADSLSLSAQGDIGAAAGALSLSVTRLSAHSATGSVYLSEADGLTLVSASAQSRLELTSRSGSITLADGARVAADTVVLAAGSGQQLVANARATVAALLDISTQGSIYLRPDASIVASRVLIVANAGEIHAGANSRIAATELQLLAQSHIGSAVERLILTVDHLSVISRQGSVYLSETDGLVLGSSSASGQFDLASLQGAITIGAGATVSADVIALDSRQGTINAGSAALLQAKLLKLSAQDGIGSRKAPLAMLAGALELNSGSRSVHLLEADSSKLRKTIAQALEFTSAAGADLLLAGAASTQSMLGITTTSFALTAGPDIGMVMPSLEWLEEGLDDVSDADHDSALQEDDAPALQTDHPSDVPSQSVPAPAAGVAGKHKPRQVAPAAVPQGDEYPEQSPELDDPQLDAASDINATNLALLGLFTLQASEVRSQSSSTRQRRKPRKSKPVASATMPQAIDLTRVEIPAADGSKGVGVLDSAVPDLAADESVVRRGGWFQRLGRWLDTQTVVTVEPGAASGRSAESDLAGPESGSGR